MRTNSEKIPRSVCLGSIIYYFKKRGTCSFVLWTTIKYCFYSPMRSVPSWVGAVPAVLSKSFWVVWKAGFQSSRDFLSDTIRGMRAGWVVLAWHHTCTLQSFNWWFKIVNSFFQLDKNIWRILTPQRQRTHESLSKLQHRIYSECENSRLLFLDTPNSKFYFLVYPVQC